MRWYVSRAGETVGPVDEAQVTAWVRGGMHDAMVRDEGGGPWTPVRQSPFWVQQRQEPAHNPRAAGSVIAMTAAAGVAGLAWAGLQGALIGAGVGFVLGLAFGNVRL